MKHQALTSFSSQLVCFISGQMGNEKVLIHQISTLSGFSVRKLVKVLSSYL